MVAGTFVTAKGLADTLTEVTERKVRMGTVPIWSMLPAAQFMHATQKFVPFRYPFSREAYDIFKWDRPADTSKTRSDLGMEFRPLSETCQDMIRWMYRLGKISSKQAGKLAT